MYAACRFSGRICSFYGKTKTEILMISPLPSELEELQQQVRKFFANEKWTAENESHEFCRSMVRAFGDAGLLKNVSPSPTARRLCFLRYAIAYESALGDLLFAMQGLGSYPISVAGNSEQKQSYLTGVANGTLIAAFAMT